MAMDRERPRGRKRRKVYFLRRQGRAHRLQGRCQAAPVPFRSGPRFCPQNHRHLRHASAPADRGHQACPADRSAALRDRLIAVIPKTRRIPARLYIRPGDAGLVRTLRVGSSEAAFGAQRGGPPTPAGGARLLWRKSGKEHQGQAPGPHFYSRSFPLAGFWVGCL